MKRHTYYLSPTGGVVEAFIASQHDVTTLLKQLGYIEIVELPEPL